jgi:hypothetical protein
VTAMSCDRAAELLSDHVEGALESVLAAELAAHLSGCPDCRALEAALSDVMELLRVPAIGPAADLADRVARASWAAARPQPAPPARPARTRAWAQAVATGAGWLSEVPFAVQAIAAAFAIALTAGLVMAAGSVPGTPTRSRVAQRISDATVYVVERKERLVEDLRLLRVVIATAFEGRLDRVNERVDDYRRLIERRQTEQSKGDKKSEAAMGAVRRAGDAAPAPAERSEPRPKAARTSV